jgi:WD40 repeat protein
VDVNLGRLLRPDGKPTIYTAPSGDISSLAISPDGKFAIFGTRGALWALVVWDLETWSEIRSIEAHNDSVNDIDISPDNQVAVSCDSFNIRVWDLQSGEQLRSFNGHANGAWAVSFTPDGQSVVSTSEDGTLRLWSLEYGAILRRFKLDDRVRDVAYRLDGSSALSLEPDIMILWDLEKGEETRQFISESIDQVSVAISPDGRTAVTNPDDEHILWDLETGDIIRHLLDTEEVCVPAGAYPDVAYSPDGRTVLGSQGEVHPG